MGRPHLSVVVPAYNEEHRLGDALDRIVAYLSERGLDADIVVVDDGSGDGTATVAEEHLRNYRGQVLRNDENRGKGYSVRRGVLAAEGRFVLLTDADLSAPIEEHAKLAEVARDRDLDIVIGSRSVAGSKIEKRQPLIRVAMGKTFNKLVRLVTGLPFNDTQCGFKLMDRERTRPIWERMVVDRFSFDVELLFLASRFGLKIAEIPVRWSDDPQTKVGLFGDPIKMFADLIRIRWRFRRGGYNP